jgi:hypothetical protein
MKKAMVKASKQACSKETTSMVMAEQLDCDLADAQPHPTQDPTANMAWHQQMGLVLPGNLQDEPSPPSQWAGTPTKNSAVAPAASQWVDPWALPAPYTDVLMANIEDILNWELDPSSDPS